MKKTKTTLLMSVAATALILGAAIAFAQAPSPAPAAQPSAPSETTGPKLEHKGAAKTPDAGIKSGQVDEKSGRRGDRAQAPQATGKDGITSKSTSSETKGPGKTGAETKPDSKTRAEMKADPKSSETPSEKAGPKSTDRASERPADAKAATSGQAAAGAVSLSAEQRTTFRTAITRQKVQPAKHVNFSISVGERVPRSVHSYPVPVELVHSYPRWRGYDYFLVGDQIIVVNPRTHEIVAVLES
jgi:hypothetical protein